MLKTKFAFAFASALLAGALRSLAEGAEGEAQARPHAARVQSREPLQEGGEGGEAGGQGRIASERGCAR